MVACGCPESCEPELFARVVRNLLSGAGIACGTSCQHTILRLIGSKDVQAVMPCSSGAIVEELV
jgi:hypothetical protein